MERDIRLLLAPMRVSQQMISFYRLTYIQVLLSIPKDTQSPLCLDVLKAVYSFEALRILYEALFAYRALRLTTYHAERIILNARLFVQKINIISNERINLFTQPRQFRINTLCIFFREW